MSDAVHADQDDRFANAFMEAIADEEFFGKDGPCPLEVESGGPRVVLVTGENASGKSFFGKVLNAYVQGEAKRDVEWICVSMAKRTEGGIVRGLMFGDEARQSTGRTSSQVALTGISTSRSRTTPHVLHLDEPDYGLSDGYQTALGEALAEYASNLPASALGFVLVTHSRHVVRAMLATNPTLVRVGEDLRPTRRWLEEGDRPRSMAELETLAETAHARYKAIQRVVDARRRETPDFGR